MAKVTKLWHREPDRQDLRHLVKGLRKDMKTIDQYLSNYSCYATQSFHITDQGFDQILAARKNSINMPGSSLVNPIFNPLESGRSVSYIFDPLKVGAMNYVGEIQPQNGNPNVLQSFPKSLEVLPQSQVGEKYGSFMLNPMLIPTTPLSTYSSSSGHDSEIEVASQHMEASTSKSQISPSHDNSHEMQPSTSKSQIYYVGEKQPENGNPNVLQSFPKSLEMVPQSQVGEKYGSFILNPMLIPTTPLSTYSSSSGYDNEIEVASQHMEASTSKSQVLPSHENSHEMQPSTSKSQIFPSHDNSYEMQPSPSKSLIEPNMQHMINTQYSQPSTSRPHVQQQIPQQIQRLNIPTSCFQPTASMSHAQQEIQCLDIPTSDYQPCTSESFTKRSSREMEAQMRAASISMCSTNFNGSMYSSSNNIICAMGNDCPKYLKQCKLRAQSKYMQENVGNLPLDLLNKTTPILQSVPSTPKGLPVIKLGNKRGLSIIVADPECIGTP